MNNIWLDPFGISLIETKHSKHKPPPPAAAPPAKEPKLQIHYTVPWCQFQMPQQLIIYNMNANVPFCNQVRPVPHCHCQHKKPAAPKKQVDAKKKKKEEQKKKAEQKKKEEEKKKALALAKEKKGRIYVKLDFNHPRMPRKGIFER